jgi:hypothetical protein
MNDPPPADSVRARMQQLRCEIDGDMEDMAASARTAVDWKHYVKTYPWVCLGVATALGFLVVPKRSRVIRPDLATLTELAKNGHLVVKPASAAKDGLIDALLATAASIAVSKATAYLGPRVERMLGMTGQREASHHDSNCTP